MKYDVTKSLWLTWKEPKTRERFVVGLLRYENKKYYFKYLKGEGKNDFDSALKKGFRLLPAFPEDKSYESEELFYTFFNRLPSRKRKDVKRLIDRSGLGEKCSDFELLKEIGGALPTDTLEFLIPVDIAKIEELNLSFYIAGTKYCITHEVMESLNEKDKLELKIDIENEYDKNAIKIQKNENKLGYVPRNYCEYIYKYIEEKKIKAELEKIYKGENGDKRIKVRIFGIK